MVVLWLPATKPADSATHAMLSDAIPPETHSPLVAGSLTTRCQILRASPLHCLPTIRLD